MSPLEIIKLVGFATGAALHFYITWLIWKRRLSLRQSLTQPERAFIVLGLCLSVWFLGNFAITLHEILFFGRERVTAALRAWDTVTVIGVALLPAALLHAVVAFWNYLDNYRRFKPHQVTRIGLALYIPMIFLPVCIYLINTGVYKPFLEKIRFFLVPYSVWYFLTMWASALIMWNIAGRFWKPGTRERTFFRQLAALVIFNGFFEFYVVAIRRPEPNDPWWVTYLLYTLLPTFFVAYSVYRYRLVDVAIKGSIVYAAFALIFIAVYTYGVRNLDAFLVERYGIRGGVIEVILILGMVALAGPVVRVMDRAVHRLFTREIGLYRDVVRQVATGAAGFGELDALARYTEEIIRRGLDLLSVRILTIDRMPPESLERRLADAIASAGSDVIEMNDDLEAIGATAAYALRREGNLIGLMIITAEPHSLTSEKRAILDVLAGQVAIEVEGCRLVEQKVQLERELASRERLATLGQMAATVAHEVKNPLSSIKSIVQVMREEEALAGYDRDLELIVSEIDRLNRTVSQLLAFSRPSRADARPARLSELVNSTVALFANEAKDMGVTMSAQVESDAEISGAQAAALREAFGNLVINAIQATGAGGEVTAHAFIENDARAPSLVVSVTDTGPGIPEQAQNRVFDPFYTTKSRGTGLGLAIVQRRMAEIGGVVELTSPVTDNHGTRFRLIVPLAKND
ncbi:MAG TPA: ATP-binding protein [Blastocatellia bacterium]|nr:ATP-binding protein [Blastocatellia bacterium]